MTGPEELKSFAFPPRDSQTVEGGESTNIHVPTLYGIPEREHNVFRIIALAPDYITEKEVLAALERQGNPFEETSLVETIVAFNGRSGTGYEILDVAGLYAVKTKGKTSKRYLTPPFPEEILDDDLDSLRGKGDIAATRSQPMERRGESFTYKGKEYDREVMETPSGQVVVYSPKDKKNISK